MGSCRLDKFRKLNSLNCVDVFFYYFYEKWHIAFGEIWKLHVTHKEKQTQNTKVMTSFEFSNLL